MKTPGLPSKNIYTLCALLATSGLVASAQTATTPSPTPATPPTDMVELSPFTVTAENVSRYQADEATSASRVRINLFDASASIHVLTENFLKDIGTNQSIDVLKYVPGVTQSTQPTGADRVEVRGFQLDGRVMDGFSTNSGLNHMDPFLVDHVEVVKGPNAVLSPGGSPGGTINLSIKKPEFRGDFGEVTVQAGQYNADKVSVDVNKKLSDAVAMRLVLSETHAEGYYGDWNHQSVISPGITWRFGSANVLSLYAIFDNHRTQNFVGIPIDPSASSTHDAGTFPGVARNANPYDNDEWRNDLRQDYFLRYTGRISEHLNTRVAAHLESATENFRQFNNNPANSGGTFNPANNSITGGIPVSSLSNNLNPLTGYFDPTTIFYKTGTDSTGTGTYTYATPFSSAPAPTPTSLFVRSGSEADDKIKQYDFQNDYVYEYKRDGLSTTSTLGLAYVRTEQHQPTYNMTKAPYDILAPFTYSPLLLGATAQNINTVYSVSQAYLNESASLFENKLIASGSISRNNYQDNTFDNLRFAAGNPLYYTGFSIPKTFYAYGLVGHPVPDVSIYYQHSENAAVSSFSSVTQTTSPLQSGKQDEGGARYKFLGGRGQVSVAYFTITQSNVQVPNPGNLASPTPNPPLPNLSSDRIARGWEYETNIALTKEWSVVGNYTHFRNRDFFGAPFRGTAETSGAAFINYTADQGELKGFGAGLGVSYLGRRPGDAPKQGYAIASVQAGAPVYNQPTFWLPAYYRVDLSLSYRVDKHWSGRLFVENLLDKSYLTGALNRFEVYTGAPRNVYGSVSYKF